MRGVDNAVTWPYKYCEWSVAAINHLETLIEVVSTWIAMSASGQKLHALSRTAVDTVRELGRYPS